MASRKLGDLKSNVRKMARGLLQRSEAEGLDLLIYCTLRPAEEQAKLYRQGRPLTKIQQKADELRNRWGRPDLADLLLSVDPQQGKIVTKAGPGQSMHNYGLAFDGVPMRNGKAVWGASRPEDQQLWQLYGRLGVEIGLEWAGNWTTFKEFPHMQEPGSRWQELIVQA